MLEQVESLAKGSPGGKVGVSQKESWRWQGWQEAAVEQRTSWRDAGGEAEGLGGQTVAQLAGKPPPAAPQLQQRALPGKSLLLHPWEQPPVASGLAHLSQPGIAGQEKKTLMCSSISALVSWSPPLLPSQDLGWQLLPSPRPRGGGGINLSRQLGRGKGPLSSSAQDVGTAWGQRPHQPCSRADLEHISHGQEPPNPLLTHPHPSVGRRKEAGGISPVLAQQRGFGGFLPCSSCSCWLCCGRLCRALGEDLLPLSCCRGQAEPPLQHSTRLA